MKIVNNVVYGNSSLNVPAHLSYAEYMIDKLKNACQDEKAIALIDSETGVEVTYRQLLQDIVGFAQGLRSMGVRRGSVVGMCCESRPEHVVAVVAAMCAGAAINALNVQYTDDEMKHVLNISKPTFIIASEDALSRHLRTFGSQSHIQKILQIGGNPQNEKIIMYNNSVKVSSTKIDEFELTDVQGASDTLFILNSSGTTGLPKAVELTHLNILYGSVRLEQERERADILFKFLTVVPWYHAYGLIGTMNLLCSGKTVVYMNHFNPVKYLETIQKYEIHCLLCVPPIVVFIAKSPLAEQYDLSSVMLVTCGAAPLSAQTMADAKKRLPNCVMFSQGYGMTESSMLATLDIPDENDEELFKTKPGSGGRPLPGIKIKVVDPETRKRLGPQQEGEICLKGPLTMKGYANNEEATRDIFDEEGYMKTGDIGYYDEEGYFFIVDRLKDLIKYKGHQVPPALVESVLLRHPGVAEAGVVGAPDDAAGELPTAFVVRRPGAHLTEQDLIEYSNQKLSKVARLYGGVIFVDHIPKNPTGKILRRELRKQLLQMKKSKL